MADDRTVMETGHPVVNREESFVDRQGRRTWLLTSKLALRDEEGKIVGLIGIGRDITALKETEEAQRASEARLNRILAQADCLLWQAHVVRVDDDIRWERFQVPESGLCQRVFGVPQLAQDRALWSLVEVPELPEMTERCEQALFGGASGYSQEFRVIQPSKTLWLQERVSITINNPGDWGLVGVVTRQREAEQKVDSLHHELVRASRSAGMAEVASGVLHNVGNVLDSVNVSATLVADRLGASRLDGVGKLAHLLEEHAGNLVEFLTVDERGRKMPGYVRQLAAYWNRRGKHDADLLPGIHNPAGRTRIRSS